MIKAVFFDIDGTLYSHRTHRIPQSALDALKLLRDRGVLLFIATGRHKMLTDHLLKGIFSFDGYVTLNGQLCLDREGRIIYGCPFTPAATEKLVALAQKKTVPMTFVEENRRYINYVDERVEDTMKSLSSYTPPVDVYRGDPLYQVAGFLSDGEVQRFLSDVPDCRITRWHEKGVDIIPAAGGKQIGIQKLLEHYGLSSDEIMAFGDGDNDADMLKFARIGIAMGNASEKAKAAADYVTSDIDEDGILRAMTAWGEL